MAVAAGDADGFAAVVVNQRNDFFVHMAAEHHFDDVHRFAVGNAHSLHKFPLFADFAQHFVNLRTAAVDHHGIDADQFQ